MKAAIQSTSQTNHKQGLSTSVEGDVQKSGFLSCKSCCMCCYKRCGSNAQCSATDNTDLVETIEDTQCQAFKLTVPGITGTCFYLKKW